MATLEPCWDQCLYRHLQTKPKWAEVRQSKLVDGQHLAWYGGGHRSCWKFSELSLWQEPPSITMNCFNGCKQQLSQTRRERERVAAMCLTHTRPQQPEVDSAINEAYPPSWRILGKAHSAGNALVWWRPHCQEITKYQRDHRNQKILLLFFLFFCTGKRSPQSAVIAKVQRENVAIEKYSRENYFNLVSLCTSQWQHKLNSWTKIKV